MQRAVLLILAFGLALCLAIPSHRHHPIYEDLEKDVSGDEGDDNDDDQLNAEEENEVTNNLAVKGSSAKDSLLAALDCGSSGTKLFLFAKNSEACPAKISGQRDCKDNFVKFTPTMSDMTADTWRKALTVNRRVHTTTTDSYHEKIKYVKAFATAGNRIIRKSDNTTAWEMFKAAFAHFDVSFVGMPGTIPGTHEAFLEFKALNSMAPESPKSFISMGGASAQAGVVLNSSNKKTKWLAAMNDLSQGTNEITTCNNQEKKSDFITVVDGKSPSYSPMENTDTCEESGGTCVGLFSWLGTGELTNTGSCKSRNSNNKEHHITAGVDSALVAMRAHSTTAAVCFGDSSVIDPAKCAKGMETVSSLDHSTKALKAFLASVRSTERVDFTVIAVLKKSTEVYGSLEGVENSVLLENFKDAKNAKGMRFAFWGVHGLLKASGALVVSPGDMDVGVNYVFDSVKVLNTASANWIKYEAQEAGFGTQCPLYFEAENYSDIEDQASLAKVLGDGECAAFLDKEVS